MSATLFTWLQGADFYREIHETAAMLLPHGPGRSWLDVGSGPGLLSRIGARRGYRVRGVDRSEAMIAAAQRQAREQDGEVEFAASDLEREVERGRRYDVVSASSLLVVLPDPQKGLAMLRALAKPNGNVLVIEATPEMSRRRALGLITSGGLGSRAYMLLAWAIARSGRTLPEELFRNGPGEHCEASLLGGLVSAHVLRGAP